MIRPNLQAEYENMRPNLRMTDDIAGGSVSNISREAYDLGAASVLTNGTGGPLGEMMTGMPAFHLATARDILVRGICHGHRE